MAKPRLHTLCSLVGVVLLALAAATPLLLWTQRVSAANEGAQALIDQALALWQQSKRAPGPELTPTDLQAKALLERVVAEYLGTEEAADALRHLAFGHYYKGRKEEATAYYNRLFTEYPTAKARAPAWMDLTGFAANENRVDDAIRYATLVAENFPSGEFGAHAKMDLGRLHLGRREAPEAQQWYERVIREHEGTTWAREALAYVGVCQDMKREYVAAAATYAAAAQEQDPTTRFKLMLCKTLSQAKGGDLSGALEILDGVGADPRYTEVVQDPEAPASLMAVRAEIFLAAGRVPEALRCLSRLREEHGATQTAALAAADTEGAYRRKQGDLQGAFEAFSWAANHERTPPLTRGSAWVEIGRIFSAWGLHREAVNAYEEAVKVAPEGSWPAVVGLREGQEAREMARVTGPALALLQPDEAERVVGEVPPNYKVCADCADCGSPLCLPDTPWGEMNEIESYRWIGVEWCKCRDQHWWEFNSSCYDNTWQFYCARLHLYTGWSCSGTDLETKHVMCLSDPHCSGSLKMNEDICYTPP